METRHTEKMLTSEIRLLEEVTSIEELIDKYGINLEEITEKGKLYLLGEMIFTLRLRKYQSLEVERELQLVTMALRQHLDNNEIIAVVVALASQIQAKVYKK